MIAMRLFPLVLEVLYLVFRNFECKQKEQRSWWISVRSRYSGTVPGRYTHSAHSPGPPEGQLTTDARDGPGRTGARFNLTIDNPEAASSSRLWCRPRAFLIHG